MKILHYIKALFSNKDGNTNDGQKGNTLVSPKEQVQLFQQQPTVSTRSTSPLVFSGKSLIFRAEYFRKSSADAVLDNHPVRL